MKKTAIIFLILFIGAFFYAISSYVPEFNGIDVSHHNKVNWENIKQNDAIKFCYIKATEGKSFRDPMCHKHAESARKSGLHVGLYHYFRTDVTAEAQFKNFKRIYDNVPTDLIPVIDVEEDGNNFSDTELVNERLEDLIDLFEENFGCKPIIYTGSWCCLKVIPTIHDCPLWVRFIKGHNLVPNTTIKQAAIVDNIDMNYCKDINKIILR